MKILVILLCLAFAFGAPAPAAEEHKVEKRSPDDDVYLFYPSSSFRGLFGSSTRTSFSGFRQPVGGYFLELDDRRKRQVAPADAKRQKRAADFDDDDDRVLFVSSPYRAATTYSSVVPRTRYVSTIQRPVGRFFIDYDDLFDDRRKRQIKPEDAKRQKRHADFDDDDDDKVYYISSPVTTYSAPVAPAPVAAVAPAQTVYFIDDDDDDHDRKKRSADPDDDDDDDFRLVYTPAITYSVPAAPVVYTQPRTSVQPVSFGPNTYFYDFDDKK